MELLTRSLRRDILCLTRRSVPTFAVHVRELRNYPIKVLCRNHKFVRKAAGSYFEVEREWNLGLVLQPSEVKSLRDHNADLSTAFAAFYQHELFLHDMNIPVWRHGLIGRPEPTRVRKLLANRAELKKLEHFANRPNAQLIPMRVEVGITGWIKVILAACFKQGQVDHRRRDDKREINRQLRDW
ncbi:unnamed protein product [Hyaloperonospora brassicae]|uniref:SsrA-binding protein n=1 Tax=Hyaloperonospora brassicae TaxID=162125 RepID=A0AAV0T6W8_HYABA|nr:unnamed protein product [Hyaloperonospora brassicae]